MFTGVPLAPLAGLNPEIVGVGNKVKLEPLVIIIPFTEMEIGPVTAFIGTFVFI